VAIFITGGARSGKSDFGERYAMKLAKSGIYIATSQIWDDEMAERVSSHRQTRDSSGFPWETIEEPYRLAELLRELNHSGDDAQRPAVLVDCITLWLSNWLLLESEQPAASVSTDPTAPTAPSNSTEMKHPDKERIDYSDQQDDQENADAGATTNTANTANTATAAGHRSSEGSLEEQMDELVSAVAEYRGPLLLVSNEVGSGIVPAYRLGRKFRDVAGRLNRKLAASCDEAYVVIAGIPLDLKALAFKLEET